MNAVINTVQCKYGGDLISYKSDTHIFIISFNFNGYTSFTVEFT